MEKLNRRDFFKTSSSALVALALTGCAIEKQGEANEIKPYVPNLDFVECDFLIHRGTICDGNNTAPFIGDIAIKGDKILKVDKTIATKGAKIIDARGKIVAPGFIDIHTHTENYIANGGTAEMILLQGVTTQIGGNCGASELEIGPLLDRLDGKPINYGMFAGYRELRRMVVENRNIRPTYQQTQKMFGILEKNLKDGAFGLSIALEYWPQGYASTEEIIELGHVLAYYGGICALHLRSEGDKIRMALEEALEIASQTNLAMQHSHIKIAHSRNWYKIDEILKTIEDAQKQGIDIKADAYGYEFSSNDLHDEYYSMSEENVERILMHPLVMIGSDSGLNSYGGAIHPRTYGNYPRIISKYVREKKIFPIETAIHKMTVMPAERLKLKDRGRIANGLQADIVIFDLNEINDRATREHTNIYAQGVENVLVNGRLAVKNGIPTGIASGVALKKEEVS